MKRNPDGSRGKLHSVVQEVTSNASTFFFRAMNHSGRLAKIFG